MINSGRALSAEGLKYLTRSPGNYASSLRWTATQFFWATLMSPLRTKHVSVDVIITWIQIQRVLKSLISTIIVTRVSGVSKSILIKSATAGKAPKAWALSRFWVSIRSYKKQLVKKICSRILGLVWLKFAMMPLLMIWIVGSKNNFRAVNTEGAAAPPHFL